MVQIADGWPEITYRYVEHYFWEPQHLLRTENSIARAAARGESRVEAVYRHLRTQEVPLNYLLNVFLRLAPSSLRYASLEPFRVGFGDAGLRALALSTPRDFGFIQPDVHLESETSRVFIEVKVDAPLTLAQIKKYVRLHAELDADNPRPKRGYVLLLLERASLKLTDINEEFAHEAAGDAITKLLELPAGAATFGVATWRAFARKLEKELDERKRQHTDLEEMLQVLVGDFLADLRSRNLLRAEPAVQQVDGAVGPCA